MDHLLKFFLDEAVLLFVFVVFMLHKEVVVGQNLIEVGSQVKKLANLLC